MTWPLLGLTAIRVPEIPEDAEPGGEARAAPGRDQRRRLAGLQARRRRHGRRGGAGELGIPGVTVELRDSEGDTIDDTKTETNGTFAFDDVEAGQYHVRVASTTFAEPFRGVNWLGDKLITPAIMFAFIWIQAGFAMVIIAAGLASIPRDTLEAARTDGGERVAGLPPDHGPAARARC